MLIKSLPVYLILLVLGSCKKTDYLDINAANRPSLTARISFVNARPVNTDLYFWTFTTKVTAAPVALNTASGYLDAQYGSVQINVTQSSGTSYIVSREFGNSATFSASGGPNGPIATYYHTVFAARTADGLKDSLVLFYDDLTPPPAGKAKIRFIHFANGLAPVDLVSTSGGDNTVFAGVAYGWAGNEVLSSPTVNVWSLGPFVTINAGKPGFTLRSTTTKATIALTDDQISNLTLQDGKIYTIFLNSIPGTTGQFGAYVLTQPAL
ncbi:MAG: DUF4397 domain-containing protein [Chitinophagaceae bacterium]|nr:DUF4397 domain-containing protein [Chitinophagaceae bacterium]